MASKSTYRYAPKASVNKPKQTTTPIGPTPLDGSIKGQLPIRIANPDGSFTPISEWDFGWGKGVYQQPGSVAPGTAPAYDGTKEAAAHSNPMLEGIYNTRVGDNNTAYGNTLGGITLGEQGLVNDVFGWSPNALEQSGVRNAGGFIDGNAIINYGVDPSNPFSKMALLTRTFQQQKAGQQNSYAASGNLSSGAYARAKSNLNFNQNANRDDLLKNFNNALQSFKSQRTGAADTLASANSTAASDRVNSYLNG